MGGRWKLLTALGATIALVGGGTLAWNRFHSSPTESPAPTPPEIPVSVVEPEVREVLVRARERVIAAPNSESVWGDLGLLFRSQKLHRESIACFIEASKLDTSNPRWPYLIGSLNLHIEPEAAIPYLRLAYTLAKQPEDQSATRLRLADALLDRHELDEAILLFQEELSKNPENHRAHFGLGVAAVRQGSTSVALAHLQIAAKSPWSRQMASALLATCYYQLERPAEARRFEQEAEKPPADQPWPDPFDSGTVEWLVGSAARERMLGGLKDRGRIKEVVRSIQEILRSHPGEQSEITLGINLGVAGDWPAAEKVLRKALVGNPHATGECFLGLSLYFQALGKWQSGNKEDARKLFEAAIVEFRKSIELKPDMGQAHLFLGCSLKYLGRYPEAAEACCTAIRVMPQSDEAHFILGEVLHEQGKSAEAVPHLEEAMRLAPPSDTRAKVLLQQIRSEKPD